ncbi:omega-hydroxyceramide transacylase-like [Vidua macroura]|uniref:omega-hydroxyceramide transacylase-like n=1 Tax=Vidua macroura TaxID=187451 RepID=UPI0023A890C3|nr:omega-hydroxyceramide transacylase-like [Vidua macroura]
MIALLCFASDEVIKYFLSRLKISLWGLVPGRGVPRLLRETLDKFLPPNAHELVSGKLHIILTRLHDWRCVTVSEFASKEELIQAVMCSCFLPLYFGIFPPTFRGVRYVDGELAMWKADFVSRTTITISGFAGEYDICPKDGPAAFLTFQLSDCILQISKMNICRLQHIFQVPTRQVMDRFYIQGYQDMVSFLKRLRDFQVNYFEGFTLSLANESNQKGDETLHRKPRLSVFHSRATDHEGDTKESPGIRQAADEEE